MQRSAREVGTVEGGQRGEVAVLAERDLPPVDYAGGVDHGYFDLVADAAAVEGGVQVLDVGGGGVVDDVYLVAGLQWRPPGGPTDHRLATAHFHRVAEVRAAENAVAWAKALSLADS